METVAICPACGHLNDVDAPYCVSCRVPMRRAMRVSPEEAREYRRVHLARLLRRRIVRWGAVIALVMLVGGWTFWTIGPGNNPPDPVSDITSAPATASDWPMSQREPLHTASTSGMSELPSGQVLWRIQIDAGFDSSPSVVDGTVYASSGDQRVLALNAESGRLIWETDLDGPMASSPTVAGDLLYFGLTDGRIIALSTLDGSPVWDFETDNFIVASPTVSEGIVYIGSGDNRLYALDALTGEHYWNYETDGRIPASPVVSDSVVGVVSQDRQVHILDAVTGRYRLRFNMIGELIASPVLDDRLMYAADSRGTVVGIDWKQREVPFERTARWVRTQLFVWQLVGSLPPPKGLVWGFRQPRESFVTSMALGHDRLFVASDAGVLFALDRSEGSPEWTFRADSRITGGPSVAGQTVYVGDSEGFLYGIDVASGKERWRIAVDDKIVSAPVIAGDTLFVTTAAGALYAIR